MVEYTGFRSLFFFIGEFGTAFAFAGLAATLFLGGWAIPWIDPSDRRCVLGPVVLFAKVMLVAFFMFWVRFTYPRLREDQLQAVAWKYLIPIGLANILLTGVFKVGVLMASAEGGREEVGFREEPKVPGLIGGLGVTFKTMLKPAVTVQYPHEREDPPARAGRHRAQGGELHGLHALRAPVPRLVHLHRGAQGEAAAAP